ncbi:dihydrodipicolinate synthase family protein [Comamonas endophytica]|uniref:Dihydrodipicolinate synthase family protein n=1 Tax=Comamonas endophytica TaxID=2949090 RepID=A0ABY6G8W7_9BURK|nr:MULTISPECIES: dihydrodipicolinate synthase family protein [unclassified Acidovorax]MCD2511408.1 dihydrodipicolinate synthase family protein [Acidovorax sp. D4N7]UYG50800.1 dihydrodipicolinate synthase family protein [Acidovorax sp. 5MLIR]
MTTFTGPALRAALDGISGILVTPFDAQDAICSAPLQPVVDRAVGAGVHVLVANGNTSEFYGLQAHEAERMVHVAAECVAGRVPLLGGVGRSVHEARALAKASARAGAAALMVHQPPDPFVAPRGVVKYVQQIAEAADGLPLVLYLRNENIGLATIEALCRIPEVIGVKWASPTPLVLAEMIRRTADRDLAWVGGLAEVWAPPLYAVGARGFTSGLINVFPERSVAIHSALERSDYAQAMRLIGEMLPFEELRAQENNGANVTVVKAALQWMGNDCGATRAPSAWPLSGTQQQQLEALLSGWKQ